MDPKPIQVDDYLKIAILPYQELKKGRNKDLVSLFCCCFLTFSYVILHLQPEWILFTYDPSKPLEYLVQSSAQTFQLPPPYENYALLLTETSGALYPHYITEDNRKEIINGSVLEIYHSPKEFITILMNTAQNAVDTSQRLELMLQILKHSSDPVFVNEFHSQQGTQWLFSTVQNKELSRELHSCGLEIFNKIMEHEIVQWNCIDKQFIDSVFSNVYRIENLDDEIERKILVNSLTLLESALQFAPEKFLSEIEKNFALPNLMKLLKNDKHVLIQQAVLAFINCYLTKIELSRKQAVIGTLTSRPFKETILQYVVQRK